MDPPARDPLAHGESFSQAGPLRDGRDEVCHREILVNDSVKRHGPNAAVAADNFRIKRGSILRGVETAVGRGALACHDSAGSERDA